MASGVTVADRVKSVYEEMKKDKKHRYIIYHIADEKQVDVEKIGARDATYEDFLKDLQDVGTDDCRYGVYDCEYLYKPEGTSEQGVPKKKLVLMIWAPDTARIKKKMLYASSYETLKKSLVGVAKCIQATDSSEASYECVMEKLRSLDRE